jgi:hypothetical protein
MVTFTQLFEPVFKEYVTSLGGQLGVVQTELFALFETNQLCIYLLKGKQISPNS